MTLRKKAPIGPEDGAITLTLSQRQYDNLVQALLTLAYAENYDMESYWEGQTMAFNTLDVLGE